MCYKTHMNYFITETKNNKLKQTTRFGERRESTSFPELARCRESSNSATSECNTTKLNNRLANMTEQGSNVT